LREQNHIDENKNKRLIFTFCTNWPSCLSIQHTYHNINYCNKNTSHT